MKHAVRCMISVLATAPIAAAGVPECVSVRSFAPYRNMGYDHLVHITNRCDKTVSCRVTTDVNPEMIEVDVAPRTTAEVLTFRGSPASTFVASVSCARRM